MSVAPESLAKVASAFGELVSPCDLDRFLDNHWEKRPLLIARSDPSHFQSLLTFDEIDRALTTLDLRYPQVRMVEGGEPVERADYTSARNVIDPQRLYKRFEQGATIIVSQLNWVLPQLAGLCRRLEAELTHPFQTNIYMTPPGARGFAPHYDTHDVFILQVAGSKTWQAYDTPIELPLSGQGWVKDEIEVGQPTIADTIHAGDTLYIPRGLVHDATSRDDISLHVTLGILGRTWTDVMMEALAQLCLEDPAFRRMLPPGFARPDFDAERLRPVFDSLIERFRSQHDFAGALDTYAEEFVHNQRPHIRGQLSQLRALDDVTADTRVAARPDLLYRFESDDEHFTMLVYGVRISFPKRVEALVRHALGGDAFCANDLPGPIDAAGKLVLVRRMIREGLVVVCP